MTATGSRPVATPLGHRAVVVLLVAVLAGSWAAPAGAAVDGGAEAQFVELVNQERAAQGLAPLRVAGDLVSVARSHSADMAEQQDLHHNPELGSDVSNWRKVGENVGRGPSVGRIHAAFMASSGHAANILHPDWTEVGVGVEIVDGRLWVTQVFRLPAGGSQPASAPAQSAPATSADTDDAPDEDTGGDAPAAAAPSPASTDEAGRGAAAPAEQATTVAAATGVPAPPLSLDRLTVTLARVEAGETHTTVGSLLGD